MKAHPMSRLTEVGPQLPAADCSVGIIGLGAFGQFMAERIVDECEVLGYDANPSIEVPGVEMVGLKEAATADVAVLAVPLGTLGAVLQGIEPIVGKKTVVMDINSVKVEPEELFATYLPQHPNVLLTHPLFGPKSAAEGTAGHKLIVTKREGEQTGKVIEFCSQTLGLEICYMDAEAHDKAMALQHVLTLFLARALADMGLDQVGSDILTPSFLELLDVARLDKLHSQEVFDTVQLGNQFAPAARKRLLESLYNLDQVLRAQEARM